MNLLIDAWAWIIAPEQWSGRYSLPTLLLEQLGYTFAAVGIAALIAVPIGWAIGHTGKGREVAVAVSGAARAIPSFGLLILLVLVIGVTRRAEAALITFVLLAIPSLLAGAYTGLQAIDRATIDAALSTAEVIFFSGITLAILSPEDRTTLLDAASEARRGGATVVFDPNLRPRLWESAEVMREAIMAAARVSDILLPSFDDDAAAFGELTTDETARRYADAGVRLVVVKNASGEMLALENGKITRYAPTPVAEIVDSTAAGDSFNAAFLARYFETGDVIKALAAGATLAAKVIGQRGALIDIGK